MAGTSRIPHAELIAECLKACDRLGIQPTTFGQKVVKDRNFIDRLQKGGRCWPETEERVRGWIAENAPDRAA